ncbi:MAG TPA: hypothetical protein VLQ48_16265 [Chloroflexia bacterium]|nr:hypothetical protein [Chloroflexia bacterium]
MARMNIRVTKLYQGSTESSLEVAFNSAAEGDRMMDEIRTATGLTFERPIANRFAMRELHIAKVGAEEPLEAAFSLALEIADKYEEVHDSQKNMKGPDEVTPEQLKKAMKH